MKGVVFVSGTSVYDEENRLFGFRRVFRRGAPQFLKLFQRRQLRQILQAELHQKFLRCLVQDRPADYVFAA